MEFINKFSPISFVERFGQSFRRFPVAMLFTIFLAGYLIYLNHRGSIKLQGFDMDFFLVFYPATGAVLAVALSLLTEDFKNKLSAFIVQVAVHALWFFVSLYLARFERFSMPQMIAVSATVTAMGLAVFLVCFYRRSQDVQFWNFSIRTLLGFAAAVAIGGLLTVGLFALIESLKLLFGVVIRDYVYGDVASVCMVLLAPSLFMNLIPRGKNKFLTQAPEFSGFSKGVVQYLFLPLLGLYMLTLYVYGFMILLRWSLPVGGVSYLVTGSMVLMVLLIYITYPVQHQEGNKLFKRVTRWLPVVMLPLLALMTVAIGRRLADYGITVSRLYLLVFNLWCYAVCLWLIFTHNKRIWLIPASFAVILFLISVGPQSIANMTRRQLLKEAQSAFTASGIKEFPLTKEQYEQWLDSVDPKMAAAIDSKLHYLNWQYDYNTIKTLLEENVIYGRSSQFDHSGEILAPIVYNNDNMVKGIKLPQGYTTFSIVDYNDYSLEYGDSLITLMIDAGNGTEYRFEFVHEKLAQYDETKNQDGISAPLVLNNGEALLMLDGFHYYNNGEYNPDFNCAGILFTK